MKISELRVKSVETLREDLLALSRSFFSLRMRFQSQNLTDTSQFKKIRKSIARVKTVLNQKKGGLARG